MLLLKNQPLPADRKTTPNRYGCYVYVFSTENNVL
nr:MAG TPA: hypothetical protein [Caudoviricetes sp.]